MDLTKLMQQAQQMQTKLQNELAEMTVEASAGGGMVTVTLSGKKELQSIRIDPEVVDPNDVPMLEDLILAAVNEAQRKVDEALAEKLGGLASAMGLPGGLPGF